MQLVNRARLAVAQSTFRDLHAAQEGGGGAAELGGGGSGGGRTHGRTPLQLVVRQEAFSAHFSHRNCVLVGGVEVAGSGVGAGGGP